MGLVAGFVAPLFGVSLVVDAFFSRLRCLCYLCILLNIEGSAEGGESVRTLVDLLGLSPTPCPFSSVLMCPFSVFLSLTRRGAMVIQEKFTRYIDFATAIVNALPPEEVPTDLADAHMIFKACDMFAGFDRLGEEDLRDAMRAVLGQAEVRDIVFVFRLADEADGTVQLVVRDLRGPNSFLGCLLPEYFEVLARITVRHARWKKRRPPLQLRRVWLQ